MILALFQMQQLEMGKLVVLVLVEFQSEVDVGVELLEVQDVDEDACSWQTHVADVAFENIVDPVDYTSNN